MDIYRIQKRLIFSAVTENRQLLDQELCEQLFQLSAGTVSPVTESTSENLTQGVQFLTQIDEISEILTRALFLRIKIAAYLILRIFFRFGGNISEIRRGYPRAI